MSKEELADYVDWLAKHSPWIDDLTRRELKEAVDEHLRTLTGKKVEPAE